MIDVKAMPAPGGAPAGAAYFACTRLSATLSTQACATRWNAASTGSACSGCPIGRQHHAQTSPSAAKGPKARGPQRECLRCGRSDLRLVQIFWVCISCYNRAREARIGQNSKGVPPANFEALSIFAVTTETAARDLVHHAIEARHAAEATGVVAMRLANGSRLSPTRPGPSAWSAKHRRMVVACPRCGHGGLLERESRGTLRHHCPMCNGTPSDPGAWALARPRAPTAIWAASTLVTWLRMNDALPADEWDRPPKDWRSTAFGCEACGAGVLQARTTAAGQFEARCTACGDHSAHEH